MSTLSLRRSSSSQLRTALRNPTTAADFAFNDRADRFVQLLRRLRDLRWTVEDYFWLCKRKRSQLSLAEREEFAGAPVIMDFRRATDTNPEDNCEFYNQAYLRQLVRQRKSYIVRIDAEHVGVDQAEGIAMDDADFSGLAANLELAEGARVILIANLAVEQGLMNGTIGDIVAIVFADGCHPNHENPSMRLPEMVVVDFPEYAGPAFYDQASRRTWVPIRVQTRTAEGASGASRSQFPLILGWALTVWKAQGLTLRRAIVRSTKCGSAPALLSQLSHVSVTPTT